MILPERLRLGDEIRIISPSRNFYTQYGEDVANISQKKLEELGFKVTFGKHLRETNSLDTASIKSRIEDLHDAFLDKNVKMILTSVGGASANNLLQYIDYDLIKKNPKIICGYSDISLLNCAITAKTGMITYHGMCFYNFAGKLGFNYMFNYFQKALMSNDKYELQKSDLWSDDLGYYKMPQKEYDAYGQRNYKTTDYYVINEGHASGTCYGGSLCTINLLQGTEYMYNLENSILFLEEAAIILPGYGFMAFDRDLQSLIQQPGFSGVKGIVFGRFQKSFGITREQLCDIVSSKPELKNIPIVADLDFGHTDPFFTFPIGGKVSIDAKGDDVKVVIEEN